MGQFTPASQVIPDTQERLVRLRDLQVKIGIFFNKLFVSLCVKAVVFFFRNCSSRVEAAKLVNDALKDHDFSLVVHDGKNKVSICECHFDLDSSPIVFGPNAIIRA